MKTRSKTARRQREPSRAFDALNSSLRVGPWLSLREVLGKKQSPSQLIADMRGYGWRETVVQLAGYAAILANDDDGPTGPRAQAMTTEVLAAFKESLKPLEGIVADYMQLHGSGRVIAHDRVVYSLISLALTYGAENGPTPTNAKLAFWMLAANDHLDAKETKRGDVDIYEDSLADVWKATRFHQGGDPMAELVRAALMTRDIPTRSPLAECWSQVQDVAFGMSFDEHVERIAAPFAIMSQNFGKPDDDGRLRSPVLDVHPWLHGQFADAARRFLEDRTCRRSDFLPTVHDPLPSTFDDVPNSDLYYRRPFVELVPGRLVITSPRALRECIRTGTWAAYRTAASKLMPSAGSRAWLGAFGDLFEQWCRRIATEARSISVLREGPNVVLSQAIGDASELEDIVVVDRGRCMLISAKTAMAPDAIAKGTASNREIVNWLEQVLFDTKKQRGSERFRGGALRLLDAKIRRIRRGACEPVIDRNAVIFPVVVTFENLVDNLAFNSWLQRRCSVERLLSDPGVAKPSVAWVGDYESLMYAVAAGINVFDVLGRWTPEDALLPTEQLIERAITRSSAARLAFFERAFRELTERVIARMSTDLRLPANSRS